MSNEENPDSAAKKPHMERQIMDEPQEEFVSDKPQPSKDISEVSPDDRPK